MTDNELPALPEPVAWWVCDANDKSSGALWSHEPTAENLQWIENQTSRKHIAVKLQDAAAAVAKERERYEELLYAVGNKYPGETRHQTALRYIRQAETSSVGATPAVHTAIRSTPT